VAPGPELPLVPLAGALLLSGLIAAGFMARSRISRDLEARWPHE
jgi:hypothetical protein